MPKCVHKQTQVPPMSVMIGYEMKTTFWTDFNIADIFASAQDSFEPLEDTLKRAYDEWKDDKVYATELVMVLNWKSWEHVHDDIFADEIGRWYAEKYYEIKDKLIEYWSQDKTRKEWLDYLVRTID